MNIGSKIIYQIMIESNRTELNRVSYLNQKACSSAEVSYQYTHVEQREK